MSKNILVIDDDPMVARSCERILGENHDITVRERGFDGLAELEAPDYSAFKRD